MIDATPPPIRTRWSEATGGTAGPGYAERLAARQMSAEAAGEDVHGEARLIEELLDGPAGRRVLDAGCGTGRVAIRLHELGFGVMGVDADLSMLKIASELQPRVPFWLSDLSELDVPQAAIAGGFDLVVLAGNVVPYLAEGTLAAAMAQLAGVTKQSGLVLAGFGIHPSDLPKDLPVTSLAEYDGACSDAGLELVDRWGGWAREPFTADSCYAVSLHRRVGPKSRPARRDGLFARRR